MAISEETYARYAAIQRKMEVGADNAVVNVKFSRRGNIDSSIDKYKKSADAAAMNIKNARSMAARRIASNTVEENIQ